MQLKVQHSDRSRKSAIIHEYNDHANYGPSDYRNPSQSKISNNYNFEDVTI